MRFALAGFCGWLLAAGSGRGEIRVRLQDYANVPAPTLAKAKAAATAVLKRAGVTVAWSDCPPHSETRDSVCGLALGSTDLQIRVLNRDMAERVRVSSHSMGYAMLAGQFPTIAAVFYHGAVELEGSNRARRAEILGATLAHEVGHLLMSDNRHSNAGILRAHWNDQDLKLISQGRMWFTTDQAERMVLLVAQRHRAAPTEVTMASGVETLTVTP